MNELVLCLLSGGVAAGLVKIAESFMTWKLNRKATKEDRAEAQKDEREKAQLKAIEQLERDVASLRIGERAIFRDRIKYLGKGFLTAGRIDLEDRQDLVDMHSIYHDELGGNGNLDGLMSEIMKLPIK